MKKTIITILLALVTMTGQAQKKTAEVKADSLLLFVQAGDSCMRLYNSFEALKYYNRSVANAANNSTAHCYTDKNATFTLKVPVFHPVIIVPSPIGKYRSERQL